MDAAHRLGGEPSRLAVLASLRERGVEDVQALDGQLVQLSSTEGRQRVEVDVASVRVVRARSELRLQHLIDATVRLCCRVVARAR